MLVSMRHDLSRKRTLLDRASALNSITHPLFSLWRQYVRSQVVTKDVTQLLISYLPHLLSIYRQASLAQFYYWHQTQGSYMLGKPILCCALVKISTPKSSNLRPFLLLLFLVKNKFNSTFY